MDKELCTVSGLSGGEICSDGSGESVSLGWRDRGVAAVVDSSVDWRRG